MADEFEVLQRPATRGDAADLARLVDMAGDGLPHYLWSRMAAPGEDAWEVGRQRALREAGGFSWRNATVLERAGGVAGCLIGYRLPDDPEVDDSVPPMFVPLLRLEARVPGSWYINVLAVYPASRGRGLGSRLLRIAGDMARATSARGTSLIVSDANVAARRLYEQHGYRQVAAEPMVKEDWSNAGQDWLLLALGV